MVILPDRAGVAVLGRTVFPAPEEVRELAWADAGRWREELRAIEDDAARDPSAQWIGFIAYEALACEEDAPPLTSFPPEPPFFFAKHVECGDTSRRYEKRQRALPHSTHIHDSLGDGLHREMVERVREAIRDGDVYQVNLTRAFSASLPCEALDLYRALTDPEPPRHAALIRGDGWSVVSASPETFLDVDRERGVAESRPIKGTVRREADDDAEIATLLASAKDAAEHLMIVDVVRNDFGKVAPPGRVSVPTFRAVHTLAQVHHLESTVRATGLHGIAVADVMAALSPAASITGAPKRAAVHMIRELEPVPRGVYCGTIGTISAKRATFSVAIRTAVIAGDNVRYHAGGGIVWDSDAAAEDDECFAKAAAFLRYVRGAS